jgi:hypothetical protein
MSFPSHPKRHAKELQQAVSDLRRSLRGDIVKDVLCRHGDAPSVIWRNVHCPRYANKCRSAVPDGQLTSTERAHFRFTANTNRTVTPPRCSTSCRVSTSLVPITLNTASWCDAWNDRGHFGRRFVFWLASTLVSENKKSVMSVCAAISFKLRPCCQWPQFQWPSAVSLLLCVCMRTADSLTD